MHTCGGSIKRSNPHALNSPYEPCERTNEQAPIQLSHRVAASCFRPTSARTRGTSPTLGSPRSGPSDGHRWPATSRAWHEVCRRLSLFHRNPVFYAELKDSAFATLRSSCARCPTRNEEILQGAASGTNTHVPLSAAPVRGAPGGASRSPRPKSVSLHRDSKR